MEAAGTSIPLSAEPSRHASADNHVGIQYADEGALPFVDELAAIASHPHDGHPGPKTRRRNRESLLRRGLVAADVIGALGGAVVAATLVDLAPADAFIFTLVAVAGWCLVSGALGLYSAVDLSGWASGVSEARRMLGTALILSWALFAVASMCGVVSPATAGIAAAVTGVALSAGGRAAVRALLHRLAYLRQRTLIVGSGAIAGELAQKLRSQTHFGLDPIGFVDDDPHLLGGKYVPRLGRMSDLADVLDRHGVDRVIVAFSRAGHEHLLRAIRTARERGVHIDIVPRLFEFIDGAHGITQVGGLPLLSLGAPRLSPAAGAVKRALDLAVSGALVIVLLPVLASIALAIKVGSRGPVLFSQDRMGRNGRPFRVSKFRSMHEDAETRRLELAEHNNLDDGVLFKMHDDPRVTAIGRFLRRFSLDELPQLFNVIRGEMSLVGPRPLILAEADALVEEWHGRRLDLRPGITGAWQVTGRSDSSVREMVRFDYAYVSGWSLARDLEILLATVPAVLSGRGAY